MANKNFQRMDKILGPPPAPLVEHEHGKEKHGFLSRFKKQQHPALLHAPLTGASAGAYPGDLTPQERKEFNELKHHQLELAKKEDELARMELELKKYEKELKERFDVSSHIDTAKKEWNELTGRLKQLTSQVTEKERLVKELDAQFVSTGKESKSKEKTLSKREHDFQKAVDEYTRRQRELEGAAKRFTEEKAKQYQWAEQLSRKEKELDQFHRQLESTVAKDSASLQRQKIQLESDIKALKEKKSHVHADLEKERQQYLAKLEKQAEEKLKHTEKDLLKEKEKLLHEKLTLEGDIAALVKRRGQLINKMNAGVTDEEKKQRAKIEGNVRGLTRERDRLLEIVKKLKPHVDQLRAQASPDFYDIGKREKEFHNREEKVILNEVRSKKTADELRHREFELGKKQAFLTHEEKEINEQQRTLKERLTQESQRVAMMLAEKEALLKNKCSVLEQQLDRREHSINQAERGFNKEKGKLYLEFEQEREKLQKSLDDERQKLYGDLQSQKDHLSKDLVELEAKKRELEHAILERKETITDLGETERLLNEKEEHLLNKIKMLEVDEQRLHARENEIVARIKQLEKDKQLLDDKEDELIDVLKKLDVRESELRNRERMLNVKGNELTNREHDVQKKMDEAKEKLETIKTNNALKLNTEELEKTATKIVGDIEALGRKKESLIKMQELQREIDTLKKSKQLMANELEKERDALEQEINKLVAKVADIEQVYVADERLKRREDFVSRKEEALEQEHQHIQEQLDQLEDDSTRAVATMSFAQQQKSVTSNIFEADSREKVEIYAMIEQARDAIVAGKYDLAKQIYAAIQEAYKTFNLAEEDRRKIYFDVVELKTDIELGALC